MGCADRTCRTVLPGRKYRPTVVFCANHAARLPHAAVAHTVRFGQGRSLFDRLLYRGFAQLEEVGRLRDERTILRLRRRLEKHKMAKKILGAVDATTDKVGKVKAGEVKVSMRFEAAQLSWVIRHPFGCVKAGPSRLEEKRGSTRHTFGVALFNLFETSGSGMTGVGV